MRIAVALTLLVTLTTAPLAASAEGCPSDASGDHAAVAAIAGAVDGAANVSQHHHHHWWDTALHVADDVAAGVGIGVGVAMLAGVSAPILPFIAAGVGVYFAARGAVDLYQRYSHGQSINPLHSGAARMDYFGVAAGALGAGAFGAGARGAIGLAKGLGIAAGASGLATVPDAAIGTATGWNRMSNLQRALAVGQTGLAVASFGRLRGSGAPEDVAAPADEPATGPKKVALPKDISVPAGQLPGSALTLNALMDIVKQSHGYDDYLRTLTTKYQADSIGSFYALHGDQTVTPSTPQVFMTYGKATIAYAPQMYTEVFWSEGEETIHFQLVQEPDGHLSINGWKFKVNDGSGAAPMTATPEHLLTPDQVKQMHEGDLVKNSNAYAQKGCLRCHMNIRRRMVEPDNHPRRLQEDPNWVFRNPADHAAVSKNMSEMFDQFANGPTKDNPIYRWMWEQPQVVARGGEIRPEDTFTYKAFYTRLIDINGHEMLGEMKRLPNWQKDREAFAAAVQDSPRFDELAQRDLGYTPDALAAKQAEVERMHAETNLAWIRKRNDESIAFILAKGSHPEVPKYENNDYLLINKEGIRSIGPRIVDMVVSDSQWAKMSDAERATHVRLSDLDVKSMDELRGIADDPAVVARTRRRTNAYITLLDLNKNNRTKSLAALSSSVLGVTAETGNADADVMDVYAQALRDPKSSSINARETIDTAP